MTKLILLLVMTHMTIISVTIYLHRCQAHLAVDLHPVVSHAMRFWLWFTTGMVTKEWVAVHRKHHQRCEKTGDPHSPHVHGIWKVLFAGALLYNNSAKDHDLVNKFGKGCPQDWVERTIYSRYHYLGVVTLLAVETAVFGWWGLLMWLIQMAWIPFWAAGVINGLGHWCGYRNTQTPDRSTNLVPWGIVVGGEELHNNHHADPASARLSRRPWEVDIGWWWICLLQSLGLARVKRG